MSLRNIVNNFAQRVRDVFLLPEGRMALEYLPPIYRDYYVYAMMCQDGFGPLYVKFGRTMNLSQRIIELRVGCPIPLVSLGVLSVKNDAAQDVAEKALHMEFASRNVTGEWFKFDITSDEDRHAFHKGCAKVFAYNLGPGFSWTFIDGKEYLDSIAEKRPKTTTVNRKSRRSSFNQRTIDYRKAEKELADYRQY